jgi:TolB-like protein
MAPEPQQRRLAAILAADVVGFSRLMEADEAGTLAALKSRRKDVLDPLVARHAGRVFKVTGDGVLVEFASAVNAVQCAVELQQAFASANEGQPEEQHIVLRIGVNLGDVMVEGGDLYGDGVNIAARLEGITEPGSVALSGAAYDQVRGKINKRFDDLGAQNLRNIAEPVRVYRVIGLGQTAPVSLAPPALALPRKPSIAVLPFTNMSGDPEQEYFADGVVEEIITALSRFRGLFVIARNSSFAFKGKPVDMKEVGRRLGALYVVEGSIRKAGGRVRITAQLIEAAGGTHLWAERYDRDLHDIFALQDEISASIVGAVAPQFLNAEVRRVLAKRGSDLGGWEILMKARWHYAKFDRESHATAQTLLAELIARDPDMGAAHSLLALTHVCALIWSWSDAAEAVSQANAAAGRALALDGEDAVAHAVLGLTLSFARRYDESFDSLNRAIALNPNLADAYGYLGVTHGIVGDYPACVESVDRACRLSPFDSGRALWLAGKGIGAFVAGRYDDVMAITTQVLREFPNHATAHRQRAAALAALGRLEEARAEMTLLMRLVPGLNLAQVRTRIPVKDPAALERWLDCLRQAGLPE